jgi:hypothetical protein
METDEIADRLAIDHMLMSYYRGVDRADYELIRSCFFDDANADYGVFFNGSLDEFMVYLSGPTALGGFERTFHFAGNTLIEVNGDVAHSEVYVMAQHRAAPDHAWSGAFVTTWLRYIDRLERRDGAWRIAARKVVTEWIRRDDGGGWLDAPDSSAGRRDRTDPSYLR